MICISRNINKCILVSNKMEEVDIIEQLADSLSLGIEKLEQSYNSGKTEDFAKIRNFILSVQRKIQEEIDKDV